MSYDLRHTAVIEDINEFCLASTSPDSGPSPVNDILLVEEGVLAAVVCENHLFMPNTPKLSDGSKVPIIPFIP